MKALRRFTVRTALPESIAGLGTLAANLRWSWHRPTADLFRRLDPARWEAVREDPTALLGSFTRSELAALAGDAGLVRAVADAVADLEAYLTGPRWHQRTNDGGAPRAIAYFSPEFGITAALPQYSGGLGILAGDHLKAASDLGLPLVGVGLFYASGYFRQSLDRAAWQQEDYPVLDPHGLPLALLREEDGTQARVELPLPHGRRLLARIWRADVGRVPLLLLDSDLPENDDAARRITDRLYGGGGDHRLQQELLLGVGGVRALRAYSRITGAPEPEVYHTNEGHAGFQGIERIRELMTGSGLAWDEALVAVRAATLFTTHTPVPAGIDRFEATQVAHFLGGGIAEGVPLERAMALGAEDYAGGDPHTFNMAVMGLRLAQRANGVAKLHGSVSRAMFAGLWPGFDTHEVPITSVTNGVHVPTWVDPQVAAVAREHIGDSGSAAADFARATELPDEAVWSLRRRLRLQLVEDARRRLRASCLARGMPEAQLGWTSSVLDPDVLTIGFARRVPTYKRLTLMLRDPQRLKALLLHPTHPIQLVIAGKSHPADEAGKKMIQDLVRFTDDPAIRHRIVFLPNYDMGMARTLFPGCDVWLNNPLRPLEACGTSGMKAAINGGLNLSILDGWWDEMHDGDNGWAIPSAGEGAAAHERDELEAAALYSLLENTVAPRFYGLERHPDAAAAGAAGPSEQEPDGLPRHWIRMIKHTLADLGPRVSATRMVREYAERLYRPAAESGRAVSASGYVPARQLAAAAAEARAAWPGVAVEHVDVEGIGEDPSIGDRLTVRAHLDLAGLAPGAVAVQALFGPVGEADDLERPSMVELDHDADLGSGRHSFVGELVLDRPGAFGYTVRAVPRHGLLSSDAELGLVAAAR